MKINVLNIQPVGEMVLIEREKRPEKIGSIHLPVERKENVHEQYSARGTVISVGSEVKNKRIKPGKRVVFPVLAGDSIEVEGKKYHFTPSENVQAILEKNHGMAN